MKPTSYSLMALSPKHRLHRINISRPAVWIIVAAFFLSFSITVLLLLAFPRIRVNDAERTRLAAENQNLTIENRNASLGIGKLNTRVTHMEETANRINDLMIQTD